MLEHDTKEYLEKEGYTESDAQAIKDQTRAFANNEYVIISPDGKMIKMFQVNGFEHAMGYKELGWTMYLKRTTWLKI
jgi:CRISPR/Cas system type I-B associated protein Csh2 (Cas7 group RAMP superfamily)